MTTDRPDTCTHCGLVYSQSLTDSDVDAHERHCPEQP